MILVGFDRLERVIGRYLKSKSIDERMDIAMNLTSFGNEFGPYPTRFVTPPRIAVFKLDLTGGDTLTAKSKNIPVYTWTGAVPNRLIKDTKYLERNKLRQHHVIVQKDGFYVRDVQSSRDLYIDEIYSSKVKPFVGFSEKMQIEIVKAGLTTMINEAYAKCFVDPVILTDGESAELVKKTLRKLNLEVLEEK